MANGESKAQEFALLAEKHGWEVDRVADGGLKTVIARRAGETVEAQWLDNHALGPLGTYTYPDGMSAIKNAASGRRILASESGNYPKPVARRGPTSSSQKRRTRRARPLPFNPYETSDDEVIAAVLGKKIYWTNHFRTKDAETQESARVPAQRSKHLRIENSRHEDTLGERILTFCDADGGGFRSCFIGAISRVGH